MNETLSKCLITINNTEVEISIKNIKSLRISIQPPNGKICVSAPKGLSAKKIKEFILEKWTWIEEAKNRVKNKPQNQQLSFVDGENILLFGRSYILENITDTKNKIEVIDVDKIAIHSKPATSKEFKQSLLDKFYKEQLCEKLETLVPLWEEITRLKLNSWKIQKMKTRWGSCNVRKRTVTFNLELVKHTYKEIEYVVLHELSHLVVQSHNQDFKNQLSKYMPNWKYYQNLLNNKN